MSTGISEFLNTASKHENFKFIRADLIEKGEWASALEDIDIVYHMAANADIRGGLHEPQKDIENNTIATFNVLEAMREHGVKKIIFASSAAALGSPMFSQRLRHVQYLTKHHSMAHPKWRAKG